MVILMYMPPEGMSLSLIRQKIPQGIHELIASINDNISVGKFETGSITDDSLHTFLLIDALDGSNGIIIGEIYMCSLAN